MSANKIAKNLLFSVIEAFFYKILIASEHSEHLIEKSRNLDQHFLQLQFSCENDLSQIVAKPSWIFVKSFYFSQIFRQIIAWHSIKVSFSEVSILEERSNQDNSGRRFELELNTLITLLSVPVLLNDLVWNFSKNLY